MEPVIVFVGVTFAVIFILASIAERNSREEFFADYPPISNREYLNRFKWDVDPDIAIQVRHILADAFGVEPDDIYPHMSLLELEEIVC